MRMHVHAKVARLLGSEVTSLAESEIGQDSDGLLLLLDHRLDQILDGDHSVKFTIFAHQQQMAHVGIQHLLHARVDGVAWLGSDELAGRRRDLLYRGVLGSAAEQGDLGDVVTFGDDASEVSIHTRGCQASNVECGELLNGVKHRSIFVDGVVDVVVSAQLAGIGSGGGILSAGEGSDTRQQCGVAGSRGADSGALEGGGCDSEHG
mmetsp:Transcript_18662/g.51886  ORF Transcript_18662/g.51886 Transcript_18662/m.51886 type:complete len:206 (-) Transcript_18662:180-797(-)